MQTTIWELHNCDDEPVTTFEGLSNLGVGDFKNLFRSQGESSIAEIIQIAELFPKFVEEEDNGDLMAEVMEGELLEILHSFQKDKSPGPDGWPIEFYL